MTPFEAYKEYVALKQHFNSTYNYVTYNGKIAATRTAFDKRKDRFFFEKLAKHEDPKSFLIANFLHNPKGWIKELAYGEQAKTNYESWIKNRQSLSYLFNNEIDQLSTNFNSNFIVENNSHPNVMKLYLGKKISLETLCILCEMTGCLSHWKKHCNDPILEEIIFKIEKYLPFLHYDKEKVRNILVDNFSLT